MVTTAAVVVIILIGILFAAIRVLQEYERGVVFRLGRAIGAKGPGLILLIPFLDRMRRIDLRTVVLDIPPQDVITKDNVTVKVNAVNYFRVVDPMNATVQVEDYYMATAQLAQTTLRAVVGQVDLDELLAERDKINERLQRILDEHTDPWGVKVSQVEVKDVDLPQGMQASLARQAQATRDRRAKIIMAQAEEQAAQHLLNASKIISQDPVAVQIRFMQTLTEITGPNNTLTLLPLPIDLITRVMDLTREQKEGPGAPPAGLSRDPSQPPPGGGSGGGGSPA